MEDKNSMNIESRIADFLAGQCSEKERQELQTLLERDEEAARLMRRMSAVWAVASLPAFVGKEEENLSKIKRQVASEKPKAMRISGRRRRMVAWLATAATVALLLVSNTLWYHHSEELTRAYMAAETPYEIKVPASSRTKVTLPDGSVVTLNAGSTLRYARSFGIDNRNIWLDGEGLFEVEKDKERPFTVHTEDVQVQVLGTVFDLCAYSGDEMVTVALVEGCIAMKTPRGTRLELKPDEMASYDRRTGKVVKARTDARRVGDWTDGGLTFDNTPFEDIARKLERKFQLKIHIGSERLKRECFSGCFDRDQGLDDILREINVDGRYTWHRKDGTITIMDKAKHSY